MTDVHTAETRSRNMAAIRGKDTRPEIQIRKSLSARGYRRHKYALRAVRRRLSNAMGADHPSDVDPAQVEVHLGFNNNVAIRDLFDYDPAWR